MEKIDEAVEQPVEVVPAGSETVKPFTPSLAHHLDPPDTLASSLPTGAAMPMNVIKKDEVPSK